MGRNALLLLASVSPLLVACSDSRPGVEACKNPKLLRVQVGKTLFDLPNAVETPHALTMDMKRESEKLGILTIEYSAVRSDPANRRDCNSKDRPVANFGNDMGFVYRGDGSEPPDYRMGAEMYALVNIGRFDARDNGWRSNYLANVEDIDKVRFVERIDIPPTAGITLGQAIYKFAYRGREVAMTCQIWEDSKTGGWNKKDGPRPAYPNQCVPKMPFRAGDIVIGADQQSYQGGPGANTRLIPPEEWPKQWAYTINKILSFKVQAPPSGQ